MNWPAIELLIGSVIIGAAVNWIVMVAFFRWKKQQNVPTDLTQISGRLQALENARTEDKENFREMRGAVTDVREMFQFIRGKINGEQWTKQGGHGYWTKEK
jgi:hypothetical protein